MTELLQDPTFVDAGFLYRRFPEILRMKRRGIAWDEIAMALISAHLKDRAHSSTQAVPNRETTSSATREWELARGHLHLLFFTDSADCENLRKRLRPLKDTALLISTVGLWLAGKIGRSVALAIPLTAVSLLAEIEQGSGREELSVHFKPGIK